MGNSAHHALACVALALAACSGAPPRPRADRPASRNLAVFDGPGEGTDRPALDAGDDVLTDSGRSSSFSSTDIPEAGPLGLLAAAPIDNRWFSDHHVQAPAGIADGGLQCGYLLPFAQLLGDVVICFDIASINDSVDGHHAILFTTTGGTLDEVLRIPYGIDLTSPPDPLPPVLETDAFMGPDRVTLVLTERPGSTCALARERLRKRRALGFTGAALAREASWMTSICAAHGAYVWDRAHHRFVKTRSFAAHP
jgi:hypothetical protein